MVLVGLPGHDGDNGQDSQADDGCHHLQRRLHPVAESAQAQAGGLQRPLLVQVLGLQVDQAGLLLQEGGGLDVERLDALRAPAKRQGDGGRAGLIERLLGRRFGLFTVLSHSAGSPPRTGL